MRRESPTTGEDSPKRVKGVYIHIPFCLRKCFYCSFYSVEIDTTIVEPFVDALVSEVEYFKEKISSPFTLYIGGGTPTCLGDSLLRLIERILMLLPSEPLEFTVEANPATFERGMLLSLKTLGVNRLSLGVQSLRDTHLRLLGRAHNAYEALEALETATSVFDNVNADLIFAIPGQSLEELVEDLERVVSMGVSHLSVYGLSFDEGTPLKRLAETGEITPVGDALWREMFLGVHELLIDKGFVHYEVSNYCRNGRVCLHNMVYWTHREYFGFGPSAVGFWNGRRYYNPSDVRSYIEGVQHKNLKRWVEELSDEELVEERVMLYLRTSGGLPLKKIPLPYRESLLKKAQELAAEGLLRIENNRIYVPFESFPVLNSILVRLI